MKFEPGNNIAMKIPEMQYEATVHFYRDILLLDVEERKIDLPNISKTCKVVFGTVTLWLDCVKDIDRSALWLEIRTADILEATVYLQTNGTTTCDELEKIPEKMHWIKDPAGTVLLLNGRD